MSSLFFEVQNTSLLIQGNLVYINKAVPAQTIGAAYKILVDEISAANSIIIKCLSNDGKLIGIERSNIILKIDNTISIIVYLLKLLSNDNTALSSDITFIGSLFTIDLYFNNDNWTMTSQIHNLSKTTTHDYKFFSESIIKPKLMENLERFKEFCKDNNLTDDEKSQLSKLSFELLFSIIVLRYYISACIMNS